MKSINRGYLMELVSGSNPIIMADVPDPDVIFANGAYYMINTTMHFMPGGEILRSYDLINWEHASYVFERIDSTPAQRLEGDLNIYGKGMWAGSIRFHKNTFYVAFSCNDTKKTYLYRSEDINGPWKRNLIEGFYYDMSLLFDEDRVYVVHGNTDIYLTELNEELTAPKEGKEARLIVKDKNPKILGYEGSHIYRIGGRYYLFLIHSLPDMWKRVEAMYSADSLEDDFVGGDILCASLEDRPDGIAQGGIVQGPDQKYHLVLFRDNGALGRIPIVVPVTKTEDGFIPEEPSVLIENISLRPGYEYKPLAGSDDFKEDSDKESFGFKSIWQFNHEPELSLIRRDFEEGKVFVKTGKVVSKATAAVNTLTQRTMGPECSAEVSVDASALNEGDTAGLMLLQGKYSYAGIRLKGGKYYAVMNEGEETTEEIEVGSSIRLRADCSFKDGIDEVRFSVLTSGGYVPLGRPFHMEFTLEHFTGARFALFIYSKEQAGGEAGFSDFVYGRS